MKVLHASIMDANSGGPAMSTYLTIWGIRQQGIDAEVITYELPIGGKMRGNDIPVHFSKKPILKKMSYSPQLKNDIEKLGEYDIYHAQGVWLYYIYALIDIARSKNKPYLITPRGMLYPQDIAKNSTFFKKLSLWWRLKDDLNRAACVHVTCEDEMRYCRELGITSPMAVIPNPVEIVDYKEQKQDDIFRLGYLGRLSPRKNVEALIRAFAALGDKVKNAELLIIGGGDDKYEQFLKNEVARLNLSNVRFVGFLSNKEKDEAIASCSVLAMPSEFENLGNVILEGLVRKIPCIATKGAPWSELETHKCGWWVDYDQDAITQAISDAIDTSNNELQQMGQRGRQLMEQRYSVEAVAASMKHLYEWILGETEKPDFVYL